MHCPNCGHETSAELKFCRSCGMKLDSVARAVSEHIGSDVPAAAEKHGGEKAPVNRFFNTLFIGIAITFIGIVIGVAGQGMWGAKTTAVVLSLLGMLIAVYGFLPAAARYDRDLLRSAGKAAGKKEMPRDEPKLDLPAGEDFKPAQSVTEGTTRNLDENKTKVLR